MHDYLQKIKQLCNFHYQQDFWKNELPLQPKANIMKPFKGRLEKSISTMYGPEDLSTYPIFQGGFINFGYWDPLPQTPTLEDRIQASQRLYEEIFKRLELSENDSALEIGCGKGLGSALAWNLYHPKRLYGLDATPEQIERCKKSFSDLVKQNAVEFIEARAHNLPFADDSLDKIYSVEVLQHVENLQAVFEDVFRALKPNGKFVLTTFFAQKDGVTDSIKDFIQTANNNIDFFHPIATVSDCLKEIGFTNLKVENIGSYVWQGFDNWCALTANNWARNWLVVHKKGWVDYYIISAQK